MAQGRREHLMADLRASSGSSWTNHAAVRCFASLARLGRPWGTFPDRTGSPFLVATVFPNHFLVRCRARDQEAKARRAEEPTS